MTDSGKAKLFKNQGYHLLAWVLLGGFLYLETSHTEGANTETVWGLSAAAPNPLTMPGWASLGFVFITTPFILWGFYSVLFYFGINRAFGADHFDPKYRGGSLEKRGIFKYIPNSMCIVVLLILYHPGLLLDSRLGLAAALAHHLFVWTHYFCNEKPDMKEIYG